MLYKSFQDKKSTKLKLPFYDNNAKVLNCRFNTFYLNYVLLQKVVKPKGASSFNRL